MAGSERVGRRVRRAAKATRPEVVTEAATTAQGASGGTAPETAAPKGAAKPTRKPATRKGPAGKTAARKTTTARKEPAAETAEVASRLPVREGEERWSPAELNEVREQLEREIAEFQREITQAKAELADRLHDAGDGAGDDQADTGAKTFEREHEMSLANNARDLLAQNERAMGSITAGTYGVCEICGNAIGKARLQAFPRATLCVTCKQREERR